MTEEEDRTLDMALHDLAGALIDGARLIDLHTENGRLKGTLVLLDDTMPSGRGWRAIDLPIGLGAMDAPEGYDNAGNEVPKELAVRQVQVHTGFEGRSAIVRRFDRGK